MEYELKHYYRVKYALVCARQSFLKEPPKDDFEEYAKKIIDRAYFIILNKIDELDGTNERLLKYYKENIEKYIKMCYNKSKKGGGDMKKDIFNGKVKREYISYIWFTIILVIGIFVGVGSLLLYSAFQHESGTVDRNGLLFLGILFCLVGALYFLITIIYIRNYPKYPKLGKFCFNSDVYFVGSDSKEYRGHWRGRPAFNMITHAVEQNKDLENIKYPTKYKICFALCILGIVMLFVNIFGCFVLTENISLLPQNLQNEGIIFTAFIVLEMIDLVFSFLFAFQVKNIRKATIDEYRKSQMK